MKQKELSGELKKLCGGVEWLLKDAGVDVSHPNIYNVVWDILDAVTAINSAADTISEMDDNRYSNLLIKKENNDKCK